MNDNQVIKMSHITVIQMMDVYVNNSPRPFKDLFEMSLKELELLRDELVIEYNKVIEDHKFVAEMIYGRTPKCSKDSDSCDSIPPGNCGEDCHGFEKGK